jgi:nucleoid DNA-binding protein
MTTVTSYTATIDDISAATGTPRDRVRAVLDALTILVGDELSHGRGIRLHPALGALIPVQRPARSGTGPDGASWTKPAYTAAKFRPAALLRALLEP